MAQRRSNMSKAREQEIMNGKLTTTERFPPEKSFVIDSLPAALSISGHILSTDRKNGGISLTQKLNQFTKKLA